MTITAFFVVPPHKVFQHEIFINANRIESVLPFSIATSGFLPTGTYSALEKLEVKYKITMSNGQIFFTQKSPITF